MVGDRPLNLNDNIRYLTVMEGSKELTAYAAEAGAYDTTSTMLDQDLTLYADVRPIFQWEAVTLENGETGMLLTACHGNGGEVVLPQTAEGKPIIALGDSLMASARAACIP